MKSLVWMQGGGGERWANYLGADAIIVSSAREFIEAPRDGKRVSFVDGAALASLDRLAQDLGTPALPTPEWRQLVAAVSATPVVAVADVPVAEALSWLPARPWLAHLVHTSLLDSPLGRSHFANLETTFMSGRDVRLLDWIETQDAAGRRVRLTHASRRNERLDRMAQFFASHGVDADTVAQLRDAADHLLLNAFYEAPAAAGGKRIERTRDVALPEEYACDIAYGCSNELAVLRIADPFGSLARDRLVGVLQQRASKQPPRTDAVTGEAGLWRVFSTAALVAVSIIKHERTEVLYAVPKQGTPAARPYAFHLFHKEGSRHGVWRFLDEDTGSAVTNASMSIPTE